MRNKFQETPAMIFPVKLTVATRPSGKAFFQISLRAFAKSVEM
jgi:hypothetical protein